ncbi:MAG: protoheme IX farnesyltransferase [Verrucomicrobiales bacterium]|nr:protoheme IX farnesyltransferase [Verrucomicrobiales bacterium]
MDDRSSFTRQDFLLLTKARLSLLVIITTVFGYLLALKSSASLMDWWRLTHTVIGSALAAAAASVFNQLMEIDVDARMARTAVRPLPTKIIQPVAAFIIGWILAACGIVHLGVKVNAQASAFAAATLFVYMFIYTPMKRRSGLNTLVGAVSGALPPLIGWAAAGGDFSVVEPWFLFGLLFLWQLPHFVAINWMYRKEYEDAGFVMWSNGDESGGRTSFLGIFFSVLLMMMMVIPLAFGFVRTWAVVGLMLAASVMIKYAINFGKSRLREDARRLFLYTLIFLPVALFLLFIGWGR